MLLNLYTPLYKDHIVLVAMVVVLFKFYCIPICLLIGVLQCRINYFPAEFSVYTSK